MYVASKYEDVCPINSMIAHEKISHKAISQAEILRYEKEFLLTMDFDLDIVSPYDIHQYLFIVLKCALNISLASEIDILNKI